MRIEIILLLVLSALLHSAWNLLTKKSKDKQVFLWLLCAVASVAFFLPVLFFIGKIPPMGWLLVLLSGLFQTAYYMLLGSSYSKGDISLVYPLARGSSPLFVTLFAIFIYEEAVSPKGLFGILLIVSGVYMIHLKEMTPRGLLAPLKSIKSRTSQLALLTGLSTAGYSLVDKVGLKYIDPILYLYIILFVPCALLLPYMLKYKKEQVASEWKANWKSIAAVAFLTICSYLLVLIALKSSNVSYVSSVREISIVFTTVYATLRLKENFAVQKIAGSSVIFLGIFLIALSK